MSEIIDTFLQAETIERLQLVARRTGTAQLRQFLGEQAWNEYRQLAKRLDQQHLAVQAPPNLLFVPGVMGSLIQSTTKAGVWWIDVLRTRNHLNDLRLSPDGKTDVRPEDALEPFNIDTSYEPFLTAALHEPAIGLRWFPYDWRKLLTLSAAALRDRVLQLQTENNGKPIDLVGHSMGGLMIRAALMEHGDELWPRIGRIVFVGTPHYGSPAISGYLKNHLWGFNEMALLGLYLNRETFRSLWGVIAMQPAPAGIYPGTREDDPDPWKSRGRGYRHPCANFDLYQADSWHLQLPPAEQAQLQTILDGGREFHTRMAEAHTQLNNDQRQRMLVIAGVGYKTLFRLEWASSVLGLWKHAKKVTDRIPGDRHREGDGRVPLASAELDDVRVSYVKGVHGGLPNIKTVYEAIFAFLASGEIKLPRTPKEALSQHLAGDTSTSDAPALDGSARAADEDPGFLDLSADTQTATANQAKLEQELLADVQYARLL
jgi:pimeloyl-ACP methyl ester carboxylesterase